MESWLVPTIAIVISALSLWWKITTKMATKDDITELKNDIREIRQMLFSHISNAHTHD